MDIEFFLYILNSGLGKLFNCKDFLLGFLLCGVFIVEFGFVYYLLVLLLFLVIVFLYIFILNIILLFCLLEVEDEYFELE